MNPNGQNRVLSALVQLGKWMGGFFFICLFAYGVYSYFHAGQYTRLNTATVKLAVDERVGLGSHELGAPLAESKHILLERDAQGAWSLRNVSLNRAVWIKKKDGSELYLGQEGVLAQHQVIYAGNESWKVKSVQPKLILASVTRGTEYAFDGRHIERAVSHADSQPEQQKPILNDDELNFEPLPAVPDCATSWLGSDLSIGGYQDCNQNIAAPLLPRHAISIRKDKRGNFIYHVQTSLAWEVCVFADGESGCQFDQFVKNTKIDLNEVKQLIIGRTKYEPALGSDFVTFKVIDRGVRLSQKSLESYQLPENLSWHTQSEQFWHLPSLMALIVGALVAMLCVIVSMYMPLEKKAWRYFALAGLGFGTSTVGLVDVFVGHAVMGLGWSYVLIALSLFSVLWLQVRHVGLKLTIVIVALLMGFGTLTQFVLGINSVDSDGFVAFQKMVAIDAMVIMKWHLIAIYHRYKASWVRELGMYDWLSKALMVMFAGAICALVIQMFFGNEAGVWGFQPVELVKAVIILLGANASAMYLDWIQKTSILTKWISVGMPVAIMVLFSAMALMFLDDFSPVLLLSAYAFVMVVSMLLVRQHYFAAGLGIIFVGLFAGLVFSGAHQVDLTQLPFYPERFAVWLSPETHPHSGAQYWAARSLINQMGWLPNSAVNGNPVPAVKDDMVVSFVLGRLGLLSGYCLLILQWVLVLALLGFAMSLLASARSCGDYQQRILAWFLAFTAIGLVGFLLGHFVLSWGTNLGITPIMGQPMPLISAGGSFASLFLGTLVAFQISLIKHVRA